MPGCRMRKTVFGVILLVNMLVTYVAAEESSTPAEAKSAPSDEHVQSSEESLGATPTWARRHPYSAAILNNGSHACGAVVLNHYWLITAPICITSINTTSYIIRNFLKNYVVRVGSNHNFKGGYLRKIRLVKINQDSNVALLRLQTPLVYTTQVRAVELPGHDHRLEYGSLTSIVSWASNGHMQVIHEPLLDTNICDAETRLAEDTFICLGGADDEDKSVCRKDNGAAVIQNDVLIGLSLFEENCTKFKRSNAFPKISIATKWINSTIWDHDEKKFKKHTKKPAVLKAATLPSTPATSTWPSIAQPNKVQDNVLALPFTPMKVPLGPAGASGVKPGFSYYEKYLHLLKHDSVPTTTFSPATERDGADENGAKMWLRLYANEIKKINTDNGKSKFYYRNRF